MNSGVGAFFEVTLGTPQTDVAAGHYGLRVAGSVSGSTDLELNVEGQDRYTLDLQAPDLLGDSASSSGWSPNDQYRGWGCVFQVSSPVTVHGLSAEGTVSGAAASPASRRFGILDTSGRWLTYGESEEGMAAGRVIPMRYALDLEPGVNYIASVLAEAGAIAGYGDRDGAYSGAVVSASWQPPELARIGEGGSYAKGLGITHDNADPDATFRDVVERSTGYGYDARSDFDAEGFMFIQTNAWPFGLHGRTSGLLLEGDVIVTTTVTGAPTVTPADVNLRLEVAQAGGA